MSDKIAIMLELEKRGSLPEDKVALLSEARKRGLIPTTEVTPLPVKQEAEEGIVSKVGNIIEKRMGNIKKLPEETATPSGVNPEMPLRLGGEIAGGMMDVAGAGISSAYNTLVPKRLRDAIEETVKKGIDKLSVPEKGKRDLIKDLTYVKSVTWDKLTADQQKDVEAFTNLAMIGPMKSAANLAGKTAKTVSTEAAPTAGKILSKLADSAEGRANRMAFDDAVDVVSKDLNVMTNKQKKEYLKGGKVTDHGFFRTSNIAPDMADMEIAKSVINVVDRKKSPVKNIEALHKRISVLAKDTERLPAEIDAPLDTTKLQQFFSNAKVNSEVIFGGDRTLEGNYNAIIDEFNKILSNKKQTLSSVLETRKEFDKTIERKFPGIFGKFSGDNIRVNAVKDIRMAANDFVADSLPDGNKFKELLKEQNNMFKAIDRIATKAAPTITETTSGKVFSIIKQHPFLTAQVGAGIAGVGAATLGMGGAIASALTNPLAMAALAGYGVFTVGEKVITSTKVQKFLADVLRSGAETLSPSEVKEIKAIIEVIKEKPLKHSPSYYNPSKTGSPSKADVPEVKSWDRARHEQIEKEMRERKTPKSSPSYDNPQWGERVPMTNAPRDIDESLFPKKVKHSPSYKKD